MGIARHVGPLRGLLVREDVPEVAPAVLDEWFQKDELRRARAYRRGTWAMWAVGAPAGPTASVKVALRAGRWAPVLARASFGSPALAGATFGVGTVLAGRVAGLPLSVARYAWGRGFGIVVQPPRDWLKDLGKATALQAVLAAGIGGGTAALMRARPRTWWAWAWGAAGAASMALAFLSPLVIEPLFQKTRPLDDEELREDILELARRMGVRARDVVVSDASRRTTASNAYVSGLGASRRVVLFDTLLRDFPRNQVRFVVAHELAHVAHRDILRLGLAAQALALPGVLLAAGAGGVLGRGEGTAGILRRLAIVAAASEVLGMVAAPLLNRASRQVEREADWAALQATGDPDAAIELQRGLVLRNLGVPNPPPWVQLVLGSHPTALERIGLALRARG